MEIKGCVAVITGGASGLGEACVRDLARLGAKVCIMDINAERGEKIAAEFRGSVIFCRTDVIDEKSVQAALSKTMEAFGAIHVNINWAGSGDAIKVLGKNGPYPMDRFNFIVQLHLIGTLHVIRLSAEKMVLNMHNTDGEKGVVINTS